VSCLEIGDLRYREKVVVSRKVEFFPGLSSRLNPDLTPRANENLLNRAFRTLSPVLFHPLASPTSPRFGQAPSSLPFSTSFPSPPDVCHTTLLMANPLKEVKFLAVARRSDKAVLASRIHTADKSYVSCSVLVLAKALRAMPLPLSFRVRHPPAGLCQQRQQSSQLTRLGVSYDRQGVSHYRVALCIAQDSTLSTLCLS
jgi:hypothetical protein